MRLKPIRLTGVRSSLQLIKMKVNYIRITASVIVLSANALLGNTKVSEATVNAHKAATQKSNSFCQPNTYNKSTNTIIPATMRTNLP